MGADPRNGLAATEWQHARKNCRRPNAPVLGPEACGVFGTEESCKPNSAAAESGLLYSKGVLLGRSYSLSGRRALEECSDFRVLERPSRSGYSRAGEVVDRTRLMAEEFSNSMEDFWVQEANIFFATEPSSADLKMKRANEYATPTHNPRTAKAHSVSFAV
jgi:hypothetical protein